MDYDKIYGDKLYTSSSYFEHLTTPELSPGQKKGYTPIVFFFWFVPGSCFFPPSDKNWLFDAIDKWHTSNLLDLFLIIGDIYIYTYFLDSKMVYRWYISKYWNAINHTSVGIYPLDLHQLGVHEQHINSNGPRGMTIQIQAGLRCCPNIF